ncbi:hypothetical protein AKJ16_DCAP01918 [Drosera capensis]
MLQSFVGLGFVDLLVQGLGFVHLRGSSWCAGCSEASAWSFSLEMGGLGDEYCIKKSSTAEARSSEMEVDPVDDSMCKKNVHGHAYRSVSTEFKGYWKRMGDEEKKATVEEELKRMRLLPANSTYAIHRLRVLNKMLQLISIQKYVFNLVPFSSMILFSLFRDRLHKRRSWSPFLLGCLCRPNFAYCHGVLVQLMVILFHPLNFVVDPQLWHWVSTLPFLRANKERSILQGVLYGNGIAVECGQLGVHIGMHMARTGRTDLWVFFLCKLGSSKCTSE